MSSHHRATSKHKTKKQHTRKIRHALNTAMDFFHSMSNKFNNYRHCSGVSLKEIREKTKEHQ